MYAMTNSARTVASASQQIRPVSMFKPLAPAGEANPMERLGSPVNYDKNRTIYFEGDEATHYFRVRSGMVRLSKVTEDGRRQIAAFLTAGDLFGWTDQDAYNYSAEAVTDATVEKYSRVRIEESVKANPSLGRSILGLLSGQLALAQDHLLLLGRMTASERIATFLLDLVRRQRSAGAAGSDIELPMNRKDVADYLGLTVETVSRTMSALKRKGIIAFAEPESVQLKQSTALERLAMAA
jgi:CRP/FNR family transcriptional regulator